MIDRILIIAFLLANTLGRFLGDKYYFIFEAISIVIAAIFFVNNSKRTTKIVAQFALILTSCNLIDELFFNPCIYGWNEWVVLVAAVIRACMQYMKQNDRHKG